MSYGTYHLDTTMSMPPKDPVDFIFSEVTKFRWINGVQEEYTVKEKVFTIDGKQMTPHEYMTYKKIQNPHKSH